MKFTIESAALKTAMNRVKPAVDHSSHGLPVTRHVLLSAKDELLTITATNFDVLAECRVAAEVDTPGALCLDADKLAGIASGVSGPISFLASDHQVAISVGRSRYRMKAMGELDFPGWQPDQGGSREITLTGEILAECLALVEPAMSREGVRANLCGTYITWKDEELRFVATDGARMHQTHIPAPLGMDGLAEIGPGVIVPGKACMVLKVLSREADNVLLRFSMNRLTAFGEGWSLATRLVSDGYVSYEQATPSQGNTKLEVDRVRLAAAINRVEGFGQIDAKYSGVALFPNGTVLSVAGQGGELGQAVEEIDAQTTGDLVPVTVRARSLTDILKVLTGDNVTIYWPAGEKPGTLRLEGEGAGIGVIVPWMTRPPEIEP